MGTSNAWLTLLGVVVGGGGVFSILDMFVNRKRRKVELNRQIEEQEAARRAEMRAEMALIKEELREVEAALDEWKDKYYSLMQEYIETKGRMAGEKE